MLMSVNENRVECGNSSAGSSSELRRNTLFGSSQGPLFNLLAEAALLIDAKDSLILDANEAALQTFGYSIEEIQTLQIADLGMDSVSEHEMLVGLSFSPMHPGVVHECSLRHKNGRMLWMEVTSKRISFDDRPCVLALLRDVTARKETEERLRIIREALEDCGSSVLIARPDGTATYLNAAFGLLFGYTHDRLEEVCLDAIFADPVQGMEIFRSVALGGQWQGEIRMISMAKREFLAYLRATPVLGDDYDVHYVTYILNDITERKQLEAQVFQSQNMKAIGQLAAGIAHEINTPTQYIGDNVRFLRDNFSAYLVLAEKCVELIDAFKNGEAPSSNQWSELQCLIKQVNLSYLRNEIPMAFTQTLDGIARVSEIVRAMRQFTHVSITERKVIDLNQAIQNAITVTRNEWRYAAAMETNLDPDLPAVPCFPGEINQVLLNLIVNAAHAIGERANIAVRTRENLETKGRITISTRQDRDWVEMLVADTGTGIPEAIREHVFDLFFSTKDVGKGTGQGLSICHAVVVEKHKGTISFETEAGKGTTFIVRLPLNVDELDEACGKPSENPK